MVSEKQLIGSEVVRGRQRQTHAGLQLSVLKKSFYFPKK
jgi:hypothetical protein